MKKISKSVKENKLKLIGELMQNGITQFEVDTNDTSYTLRIIVKQSIATHFSEQVAEKIAQSTHVEDYETYLTHDSVNQSHTYLNINLYMGEK